MQMIDVLTRLAQLDSGNSNVVNPMSKPADKVAKKQTVAESGIKLPELPEPDLNNLKVLSGLQQVNECGPMGMMDSMGGHMEPHRPPATFSINASAADGDEVAGMLSQIMNLAGVHKVGAEPVIGGHDSHDDQGAPAPNDNEIMRSMLDTMNEPEDETTMTALPPPEAGADAGGGLDDLDTGDIAGDLGAGGEPGDLGDMADQVRDMADELSGTSKDELGLESYDNTPADPTNVPAFDANKMSWNPNAGGVNKGVTNQPTATLEDQLYNEYKKFVNEAKAKCCCEEKGKTKCPVHGKAVSEAEEKTMSRAAKGMMKYGKEGMKALAKAGKEGKDLDKVRDKYNKYDEGAKWRDPKYKDKLYTQVPRDDNDDYYSDDDYYNPKPDDYPGAKNLKGGGEFDNNDPLDMRHDISRNSNDPEMWGYGTISSKGKRKGLPTRSVVNNLKDKIKQHQGAHPRPSLPR